MKTKLKLKSAAVLLLFATLGLPVSTVFAQGTAFTFQGQLLNNGSPENGPIHLNFGLYSSITNGTLIAGPIAPNGGSLVSVNSGLFTVALDFGSNPNPFTGQPLWLEIDQSISGNSNSYSPLSPRVQITPTPYAVFAENATGLANGAAIGAGAGNSISASGAADAFIGGGTGNQILQNSLYAAVGGGQANIIHANAGLAFIGGGQNNQTASGWSFIGGGDANVVGAGTLGSTIAGGYNNTNNASYATVAGGLGNTASGNYAFVGGGSLNTAKRYDVVCGGSNNIVGADYSGIVAGSGNFIGESGMLWSFIGGGQANSIDSGSTYSVIGGGQNNGIGAYLEGTPIGASIGGGENNFAAGSYATVPGGFWNWAMGEYSFAAGNHANAFYDGDFVWADSQNANFQSTANDQFLVRAQGGVGINTASPQQNLSVNGGMNIDQAGANNGSLNNGNPTGPGVGLTFGSGSGEGMASQRTSGAQQYSLAFYTDFNQRMIILNNGNVGIGTINPASALQVNGTVTAKLLTLTGGADLAEPFPVSQGEIPQGSVVVIDEKNPGQLKMSDEPYDTRVAGVISGANGIHPGIQMQQQGLLEGGRDVALTGRVYVQADASNGAIRPGDLLTTSSTPGRAMKVTDHGKAQGAVLGKAMTGLSDGKGTVLVLVTLQ